MTLLEYLESLQPSPQYAQLAVGGNWENALRIEFNDRGHVAPAHIIHADPTVAGEIFYQLSDGRMFFVGVRYSSDATKVSSPTEFLEKLETVMRAAGQIKLSEVLTRLGNNLNGEPRTYSGEAIDYVELGIEGFWKSMGSVKLRQRGDPLLAPASLQKLLAQNQKLVTNDKNYTALEFAVKKPEYWFGLQVSRKVGSEFVTDMKVLTELVNFI